MPRVGFEPTTPVFKVAKAVLALGDAAIVIGSSFGYCNFSRFAYQNCLHICCSLFQFFNCPTDFIKLTKVGAFVRRETPGDVIS
jgi:hypothetical protein